MNKEGSFKPIVIVLIASMLIALFWNSLPFISKAVHAILDPSAGALLKLNLTWGMMLIILIISLITTLIQKYATDQESLRELKKEQKLVQEEMKKYKDNPQKVMELQKKSFEFIPRTMKLSMRAMAFTGIPLILFFRWFSDTFTVLGSPKFFGIFGWFLFYLIFTMVFSGITRKILKVV